MISALLTAATMLMQAQTVLPPTRVAPARITADAPLETSATVAPKTVSPLVVTPKAKEEPPQPVAQNKLVCKDEIPVGTRFPVKVCARAAEFADRTQQDQALVRDWQKTPITTKQQ